jgi:hypothetical protein
MAEKLVWRGRREGSSWFTSIFDVIQQFPTDNVETTFYKFWDIFRKQMLHHWVNPFDAVYHMQFSFDFHLWRVFIAAKMTAFWALVQSVSSLELQFVTSLEMYRNCNIDCMFVYWHSYVLILPVWYLLQSLACHMFSVMNRSELTWASEFCCT